MEATYISSNSFSVIGQKTEEFLSNRRLKLDCGTDGIKYASIISSSFTSVTVVVIDESVLTANLVEVFYSILKPGEQGNISEHFHTNTEGDGGYITPPVTSFIGLIDTPSSYSDTEGKYATSTGSGVDWVVGTDEFVPWNYGSGTISGTGDIYCNDIYTASGTVYLGDLQLSTSDGEHLLVNGEEITSSGGSSDVQSFLDLSDTPILYPQGGEYIGVTIDSNNLTSSITDFPLTLVLSESAGINSEDLTSFFTELNIHPDDSFIGNDDDLPNTNLWTVHKSDDDGITTNIFNNKLRLSIPVDSRDQLAAATSFFSIAGDFDIQVNYSEVSNDPPSSSYSYPVRFHLLFGSEAVSIGTMATGSHNMVIGSSPGLGSLWITDTPHFPTGKLRFTRNGTVIKAYCWDGTQWQWNGSTSGYTFAAATSTEDIKLRCETSADFNSGCITDFSAITINSGEVIWPNGYPYRKKIKLEDSEGNQCYTEIESWDQINKKVILHTKVPFISTTADTKLNLLYDSTMDDNVEYIGGTDEWLMTEDITGDDFTGTDGDSPNSNLWNDSEFTIQSNKIEFIHTNGINEVINLTSQYKLTGDFNIQIDFERTSSAVGEFASFTLGLLDLKSAAFFRTGSGMSSSASYQVIRNEAGDLDYDVNSFYYGAFKIIRVGDQWSFYIKSSDGSFVQYNTAYTGFTSDAIVQIQTFLPSTHDDGAHAIFDNFIINSGTVKAPGPNAKVWSGFSGVYTMAQDPSGGSKCILDSTSNNNHATPQGAMTSSDLVNTDLGKGIEFNTLDRFIQIPDGVLDNELNTVECFMKHDSGNGMILCKGGEGETVATNLFRVDWQDTAVRYLFERGAGTNYEYGPYTLPYNPQDGNYHTVSSVIEINKFTAGIDGQVIPSITTDGNTDTTAGTALGPSNGLVNGIRVYSTFFGVVSVVRISTVARSSSWIKATNDSLIDNLVSYEFNYPSKYLAPNSAANGLIFKDFDDITYNTLTSLEDTPSTYSGSSGKYLQSNGIGTTWNDATNVITGNTDPVFDSLGDLGSLYISSDFNSIFEKNRQAGVTELPFTAKSVIIDVLDNYDEGNLNIRSIEFYNEDTLIALDYTDFSSYATSSHSSFPDSQKYMFNTSLSKIGTRNSTSWLTPYETFTNQRAIVVFDTSITFTKIVVNNGHNSGSLTTGAKNTKIYTSSDTITSVIFDEAIANSLLIFDGIFDEHIAVDVADDKTLSLIPNVDVDDTGWDKILETKDNFTDLLDTPLTYSGTEGLFAQSTGSGIVWSTVSGSTPDVQSFLDLNDTPSTYSEMEGYYLQSTGSGIEWLENIPVDATGFDGNLSTTDDTLQEVAQVVDDLPIPQVIFDGYGSPGGIGVVDDYYVDKTNETLYKKITNSASILAKTIILDISDNWGDATYLAFRRIETRLDGTLNVLTTNDFTTYETTARTATESADEVFDTTGSVSSSTVDFWRSTSGNITNQRLICVLDDVLLFDELGIYNYGVGNTNYWNDGAKNVKLYVSSDEITDTTYGATIANSNLIFDGQFPSFDTWNTTRHDVDIVPTNTGWISVIETKDTFLDLDDTPSTYSGTDDLYLQSTGFGVVWSTVVESFLDLNDTPTTYSGGQYLRTTTSGIEAIDGIIITAPDTSEWLIQVTNSGTLYTTGL